MIKLDSDMSREDVIDYLQALLPELWKIADSNRLAAIAHALGEAYLAASVQKRCAEVQRKSSERGSSSIHGVVRRADI